MLSHSECRSHEPPQAAAGVRSRAFTARCGLSVYHQQCEARCGHVCPGRLESLALLPLCGRQRNGPAALTVCLCSRLPGLPGPGLGPSLTSLSPAELQLDRTSTHSQTSPIPFTRGRDSSAWGARPLQLHLPDTTSCRKPSLIPPCSPRGSTVSALCRLSVLSRLLQTSAELSSGWVGAVSCLPVTVSHLSLHGRLLLGGGDHFSRCPWAPFHPFEKREKKSFAPRGFLPSWVAGPSLVVPPV